MSSNEFPIFDGIAPSWADLQIKVKGKSTPLLDMRDVKEIKTGSTIEVGEQRSVGSGILIKRTTGSKKDEASWVLYHSGWMKLLRNLKSMAPLRRGKRALSLVHFDVQYLWTPPGDVDIFETRMKGCRIIGRNLDGAEGVDATTLEIPLSPIEIADFLDGEEVVLL